MLSHQRLQGRRIAALVADGFEQVELTVPVKALSAEGATVEVVSLRHGKILGMNLHEPGRRVRVDRTLSEVEPEEYDGLLVPGGFINPDLLRQSRDARILVQRFDALRKPIATLCHGPWVLASAELVSGRQLTSWPGIRDDLVHAGAVWRDEEVVRDGNWVTSRGPQDLVPFVRAMIEIFAERAPILSGTGRSLAPSSPAHDSPPFTVLAAAAITPRRGVVRWLVGAATALAAGGLAAFALRRAIDVEA